MLRQGSLRTLCFRSRPAAQRYFSLRPRRSGDGRPAESLNIGRLARQRRDYDQSRVAFLVAGVAAGVFSFGYTAWRLKVALDNPARLDSGPLPPTVPPTSADGPKRKVVIHDEDGREIVPTGNGTVPTFPRTIDVPDFTAAAPAPTHDVTLAVPAATGPTATEYTLVGLGLRTVSFLGIQVYVVGFYVATSDIAALQSRLVKKINPLATALVSGEKDELRKALSDPIEGEETWDDLLREGIPARSLFRVVPVRDTDFHHLRDGFVRAVQARSQQPSLASAADSLPAREGLEEAMRQFRQIFNRGKVPKKKELLLVRAPDGSLSIAYHEGGSRDKEFLGAVNDERISRALWLNYLAGRKVASEPARQNIIEGILEFVERPVGTVAAQVL